MPLVMSDLYVALKSANVPDDLAMAAAAEVAELRHRPGSIGTKLRVLKIMVAVNLALAILLLALTFSI